MQIKCISGIKIRLQHRDERTRVSEVCPCPSPCPRFADIPVSEVVSVSEDMTLSESMSVSESVSEVLKNFVSVSESASDTNSDTNSCPKSCPCPFISAAAHGKCWKDTAKISRYALPLWRLYPNWIRNKFTSRFIISHHFGFYTGLILIFKSVNSFILPS